MAIVSRLLVADGLLRALGEASTRVLAAAPAGRELRSDALALGPARRGRRSCRAGRSLASERQAIEAGKSVLRVLGERRVLLVRAPDPARAGRLIAADLDPAYLWTYDGNDPDSGLTIVDAEGQLVFSSLAAEATLGLAEAAVPGLRREDPPPPRAEAPLAEPWLLFLGSRFEAPTWYVIRSQSRELTFAPLAEFRAVFRWSLLLAVLVVTALSSVQIRRTLRPIQLLVARSAAARRGPLRHPGRDRDARRVRRAGRGLRRDGEPDRTTRAGARLGQRGRRRAVARAQRGAAGRARPPGARRHDEQRVRRLPASDAPAEGSQVAATLGELDGRVARSRRRPPAAERSCSGRPPAAGARGVARASAVRSRAATHGGPGGVRARATRTARRSRPSGSRRSPRRFPSRRRRRSRSPIAPWWTSSGRCSRA